MNATILRAKIEVVMDIQALTAGWTTAQDFVDYLETQLIPDCVESGSEGHATDHTTSMNIIQAVLKIVNDSSIT